MRVNVTYSVKLEEVSELVENILLEVEGQLEELKNNLPEILHAVTEDQNEKKAVELLKDCRQDLIEMEYRMGDCENLLLGYQNTLLQLASAENKKETAPPTANGPGTQKAMEDILAAQQQMQGLFSSFQKPEDENDSPSG